MDISKTKYRNRGDRKGGTESRRERQKMYFSASFACISSVLSAVNFIFKFLRGSHILKSSRLPH